MKQISTTRIAAIVASAAIVLALALAAGSCGGSSAPSASPTTTNGQQTSAYGVAMESAMRTLAMGVQSYYEENATYPATVTQAIVGSYISAWPSNPWTHQPIAQGTAMGDFTYTIGGNGFQLIGHLGDGKYVMAP
jgi:hypothetical protein